MAVQCPTSRRSGEHTGVDELLCAHFPALVCLDLGLELADLLEASHVSDVPLDKDMEV